MTNPAKFGDTHEILEVFSLSDGCQTGLQLNQIDTKWVKYVLYMNDTSCCWYSWSHYEHHSSQGGINTTSEGDVIFVIVLSSTLL